MQAINQVLYSLNIVPGDKCPLPIVKFIVSLPQGTYYQPYLPAHSLPLPFSVSLAPSLPAASNYTSPAGWGV